MRLYADASSYDFSDLCDVGSPSSDSSSHGHTEALLIVASFFSGVLTVLAFSSVLMFTFKLRITGRIASQKPKKKMSINEGTPIIEKEEEN